jgi:HAD superfamily hydrolase (TIGR01509 family)
MRVDCDLLIFDCDGVLVDSEQLAFEAFIQVLNEHGVRATPGMVEGCFGMKQADILGVIAARTGQEIPAGVAQDLWPATRRLFEKALKPMPGVTAFIETTAATKRCVASSSNPERIRLSLHLTGLTGYFGGAVFSSHQVANGKPAPDLFLFAAANMEADPSRCIVVEDSLYGVQGAVAAGMRVVGFVGGGHIQPGHDADLLRAGASSVEATWTDVARRIMIENS